MNCRCFNLVFDKHFVPFPLKLLSERNQIHAVVKDVYLNGQHRVIFEGNIFWHNLLRKDLKRKSQIQVINKAAYMKWLRL